MGQRLFSIHSGLDASAERGLNEIRQEHARIFALIREFIGLVRSDTDAPRLLVLLEKIIELSQTHSRNEENILRQLGHPGFATQCELHRHIIEELANFRDGMMAGQGVPSSECAHLLDSLIVHHIRDEPASYRPGELATWLAAGAG
jgi:hemerythrin-like metal-binding protein